MGQNELGIFIILVGITILIFIVGIIIFIFQYRNRRLQHLKEKGILEEEHKIDLLNNKLEVQKQTMQFIGEEIHDSVTQKLTLAVLHIQAIKGNNQCPDILEQLKDNSDIINEALKDLRRLAHSLTNDKIEQMELAELLKSECDTINETGICKATWHTNGAMPVSYIVKLSLLGIVHEFIQNSLKHAKCQQINIKLNYDEHGLHLIASDDGVGFDTNTIKGSGIGITNMKNRMIKIGGTFKLDSEPGKGTTIYLFVPNSTS